MEEADLVGEHAFVEARVDLLREQEVAQAPDGRDAPDELQQSKIVPMSGHSDRLMQ